MKPYRILLLFLGISGTLCLISFLVPNHQILLREGVMISVPSVADYFKTPKQYPGIKQLTVEEKTDSVVERKENKLTFRKDTIRHPAVSQFLEYPDTSKSSLDNFFRTLTGLNPASECIHILHYGDSQLEADRISEYLRFRFQEEFGGDGPGLLSFFEETDRLSMQITNSDNWIRTSLIRSPYRYTEKQPFGLLASYFRFIPAGDSSQKKKDEKEAWISIKGTGRSNGKNHSFDRCRVFYSNPAEPLPLKFLGDENPVLEDTLKSGNTFGIANCRFTHSPSDLKICVKGRHSPDFFGICLDESTGVSVDNIPLRGSSGLEFTRMDPVIFSEMIKALNVKLLIYQFGVNAIPGNLSDYSYYENGMFKQLSWLKKIDPELSIIVISVSDASQKIGESYETYSSVEKIVAAQQMAAKRAGCAFWNLYQAMGGRNSMPGWVFAKEPLASTDFMHFNYLGARLVARMFYAALIHDYNSYLIKTR